MKSCNIFIEFNKINSELSLIEIENENLNKKYKNKKIHLIIILNNMEMKSKC